MWGVLSYGVTWPVPVFMPIGRLDERELEDRLRGSRCVSTSSLRRAPGVETTYVFDYRPRLFLGRSYLRIRARLIGSTQESSSIEIKLSFRPSWVIAMIVWSLTMLLLFSLVTSLSVRFWFVGAWILPLGAALVWFYIQSRRAIECLGVALR